MPAKKKQSNPKKASKIRKKKEEEEQRLKEAEEARLIAEREEQERLEREQKEDYEQLTLELQDLERRKDELNELNLTLEENQKKVITWETAAREKAQWDRYMICDGTPNPAVQSQMNTFITLWKENLEADLQSVLQQCALAVRLKEELELLLSGETEPGIIQVYQETLQTLQILIHAKHQKATEEILKSAKTCSDTETGNMQMTVRDDNVTLCLWANIKKNPRFKGYHFQEAGLSFQLPKQLAVSNIAVRILHTRYDHLSCLSLRTQDQNDTPALEEEAKADGETLGETREATEDGGMTGEDKGTESVQQENDELQSIRSSEGKKSSLHSGKNKRNRSSQKLRDKAKDQSENIVEGATSSGEPEAEAYPDPEPPAVEPAADSTRLHIVDLHRYTPLGGVYYFDAFHLPSQTLTVNDWVMTEIGNTGLQPFPYPPDQPYISASEKLEESNTHSYPAIGVTVVLPESVVFMQEPQVARWDPVGQNWRTDCIRETSYNSEERSVSFKMDSFYTFTLLQETYANMPFQHWELRPQGQDSVTLTITAALSKVSISVRGNQCMFQMTPAPELNRFLGKWMSLPALQMAMCHAGVNVFADEYTDTCVTFCAKDPLMEHTVYKQMALVSSAFAFSHSQWNAQCGQKNLVLQVCEQPEAGHVTEEAWSLYLLSAQRSQRLMMAEKSDTFSTKLAKDSEFHSTFLHMLKDVVSPEGQNKLDHAHYLFVNTVQRLLCATRLLTFS